MSPSQTNVFAFLVIFFWSRYNHQTTLYLAKAAFPKHHQEVKITQLHPVPVPIVVKFGYGVGSFFFWSLGCLADLGPLEGETQDTSLKSPSHKPGKKKTHH